MLAGKPSVHAEPRSSRRRGENPIFLPPRSPRLRVRKNAASKRELSRGSDSDKRVLNPDSGTKFQKALKINHKGHKKHKKIPSSEIYLSKPLCALWLTISAVRWRQDRPTRRRRSQGHRRQFSESQLSAFPSMKKVNPEVHAELRSTRRKSNLPPSALSAPPREKKSDWQTRDRFRIWSIYTALHRPAPSRRRSFSAVASLEKIP